MKNHNKPTKTEQRAAKVAELLKDTASPINRAAMLYELGLSIKHHDTGKIAGLYSLDVSCKHCEFCQERQAAAAKDPRIVCGLCYTLSFWASTAPAHAITGDILASVEFTREELATIQTPPAAAIRINSDGELINQTHATNIVRFAATHPGNIIAIWTKRPYLLHKAIQAEGKPDNLICGVSSPMINTPREKGPAWIDFIFTVYTPSRIAGAIQRGERECNGAHCNECGYKCYQLQQRTEDAPVYVAEVLRRPKNMTKVDFMALCDRIDNMT